MRTQELRALINSHEILLSRFKALVDKLPDRYVRARLNPETIVLAVSQEFKIHLQTPKRSRRIVDARHCAAHLLRTYTDLIWAEIAFHIGVTDHSTAMHSNRMCINLMEADAGYREKVMRIKEKLGVHGDLD